MPQSAAGWRIDPPVSVPNDSGTPLDATVAAEPPEEPPGTRSRSHGLCVAPNAECSVEEPMANSSRFVLPTITAPASLSFCTTVQSTIGMNPSSIFEAALVWMPFVESRSFTATGIPVSGPALPEASARSAAAASSRARSSVNVM